MVGRRKLQASYFQPKKSKGLFEGMEERICGVLGIERLDQVSAARGVLRHASLDRIVADAVRDAFDLLAENWHQLARPSRSRENWRWRVPKLAMTTKSPEVRLERLAVKALEAVGDVTWANQVPVASGVTGPNDSRRRALDLVHKVTNGHFEFVELKVDSNNPLYAVFEILGYGFVWLLSRTHKIEFGYRSELIEADRVDLIVLAPKTFYADEKWALLEPSVNSALRKIGGSDTSVHMSFRFESFSPGFNWPNPAPDLDLVREFTQRSRLKERS